MKVEKQGETKMIQCLEVAQYQSWKSKIKKKQLTEDSYFAPVCAAQPSSTVPHSTHTYVLCNKRKRKETDYILIHQYCFLSLYTTSANN